MEYEQKIGMIFFQDEKLVFDVFGIFLLQTKAPLTQEFQQQTAADLARTTMCNKSEHTTPALRIQQLDTAGTFRMDSFISGPSFDI